MRDSVTGVEDPLSPQIRASIDWGDIGQGLGWAWRNVGQPILTGQGGGTPASPPQVPQLPPGGSNLPSTDPSWWYKQGQALRNALTGGNGNGSGPDIPLPFPLPQAGSLYGTFFGNGQGGSGQFNGLMMPGVVAPSAQARLQAPKGYVIVTIQPNDPIYPVAVDAGGVAQPDGSVKVAMMKEKARKCGYWKRRPKPALTSSDMKTLRRAARLKKKVAKTYLKAGIGPKDIQEAKKC